jgi:hypothetical protein
MLISTSILLHLDFSNFKIINTEAYKEYIIPNFITKRVLSLER